ncbi:hypothetical protein [Burkholderia ubonensis]|uniref:hypothetical protein n=1 Tax=Burkholderia ubonensis TaxID=101571 RepID=UPI0012F95D99|nr:hypothetical protein [Burkholderia ubonensis]
MHTTLHAIVLMAYADDAAISNAGDETPASGVPEPGRELDREENAPAPPPESDVGRDIARLPTVKVLKEQIPEELSPSRFLAAMTMRVLGATPVNMRKEVCRRRVSPKLE